MRIFITGATGYIGNNLALRLAREGNTVHALIRSVNKAPLLNHPNIKLFEGDITEPDSLEKAMEGCEQVYHLAAFARVWAKDVSTFYKMNVEATRFVLDAARKCGVQKIVFTSTGGVLGPSGSHPVKEDDARLGNVFNEYEDTKTQAEELCKEYCNKYGMHIVIVNPPRIYGPGIESESNAVTRLTKLYMSGRWKIMPGDGTKTGSYVYIDDIVNGHILAMQRGRSGERYILSGVNASYNEFFDILGDITGKKLKLINLPVWAMMLAGYALMIRTKLTGKAPLLTPKWIKKYFYNWSLSCEKAERELGYTYIPLKEGLQKTVDWIKQQNKE
ncbi:SDR family oxidoreductase [Danxiaibacter flavus]|uniref:SDR family oxidoreductase n=1 Tax=Danxiaibacter flavus TaxID=3049108 RepID=A0ABV3Z9U5_9BACT|nr:SDR family oxidoreductase [Chitinophagaceae bacterium DXS]